MSRFFVGQRVRKARMYGGGMDSYPIGVTGIIVEVGPYPIGHRFSDGEKAGMRADCLVRYSGYAVTAIGIFSCLEPILDPGATPSVFSYEELMDGLRSGELVAP